MTAKPLTLIAYVRVSTDDQAENGVSLSVQPAQLHTYAAAMGHTIKGIIIDEVSGAVPLAKRKGGAELLQRLDAGEADGVVVVRLDRLFRDAFDGLSFLVGRRVPLNVVSMNEAIDTRTPVGRLQLTLLLATAQYERDVAAQRATDSARGMRKAGRVSGAVPFGMVEVGADGTKRGRLMRDPQMWPVREQIVEWRLAGDTFADIASELRRRRIPAPNGGARWSKSTLSGVVKTHADFIDLPMAEGAP